MKEQELIQTQELLEQAPTAVEGGGGGGGGLNEELDGNALAEMQIQVRHRLSLRYSSQTSAFLL